MEHSALGQNPFGHNDSLKINETRDHVSDSMYSGGFTKSTELYIVMVLLSFLAIMGTAGNALVLYVFSMKKDRLTSTLFILGLAFVDFITCLIVIPYTIYMEYVDFHIRYDILCKLYQFLITCNIPFSALIMVAIAIDRYFCICHPFLHAINLRRAKIIIACLGLCAVGIGIIVGLMFGVYQKVVTPLQTQLGPKNGTANATSTLDMTSLPSDDKVSDVEMARELIFNANVNNKSDDVQVLRLYTGHCDGNEFVLSHDFAWYFQKLYTAMYLVCLIIVIILYVLIYRSVLARRTKRQKAKSKSLPLVVGAVNDNNGNSQEETLLTTVNGDMTTVTTSLSVSPGTNRDDCQNGSNSGTKASFPEGGKPKKKKHADDEEKKRKSTRKDKNRIANLKTAAMLFVVTVVFIITFFPAFLMALQLIPHSMIIFYMYFANNVANPIIYSFMNKNFRDDLKRLFCGR